MHQAYTECPLYIESHDAEQLIAADSIERETKTLYLEESFTLADLFNDKVIDVLVELNRLITTMVYVAEHKLQLRVCLTDFY